jgi:hypothetical protein
VLQFLQDEGCEWDKEACSAAAKHNHFSTLQWLHEQGCLWDEWAICGDAAEVGSMEMLLYLKQLDCEYHEDTMIGAAMRGQLAICQFLVAELCPSNAMACTAAAGAGHFEVVRFLHESGCPWKPADVCDAAALQGSAETLQYVKSSAAPSQQAL